MMNKGDALCLLVGCLWATACASAQIPYDLGRLEAAQRARHPLRVAVLPLVDERTEEERNEEDGLYTYSGVDYEPTELSQLPAPAGVVIAELLARHLVRAGSFREVVLVRSAADAPDADLYLRGRIQRARGYVEVDGQRGSLEPEPPVRRVIAEVFLSDVELMEPGLSGRRLFHADLGWSILEERSATPAPPSPWQVLGDALFESHRQLTVLLEDAVLDGSYVAEDEARMAELVVSSSSVSSSLQLLSSSTPKGWSFGAESLRSAPSGWRGDERCEGARYSARQTQRFHRALGPYQPLVRVWLCPAELSFELDHRAEFPATYLGDTGAGQHAFVWRLGASSWKQAEGDLRAALGVMPPKSKYTFRIEAAKDLSPPQ